MTKNVPSLIGIVGIAIVAVLVPEVCLAQQDKPTIEQILQVWRNRQKKVASARFELDNERTIHKGSSSIHEAIVPKKTLVNNPNSKLEPNPPRDYLVKGTSKVSLSGPQLRYSYDTQKWDPVSKGLFPEHYVDVFDGQTFKFLRYPASVQQDWATALMQKGKKSRSGRQFPIAPLIWTFRGSHPQFFNDLANYKVTGRAIDIAQRPCLEIERMPRSSRKREFFYLDKERDYVVVRKAIIVGNRVTWQLDVNYALDPTVHWVPKAWEYIIWFGTGDEDWSVVESGRRTVVSYNLDAKMDNNEFDIVFPPGTRVHDESSGREVQYVVQESGEPGGKIETMFNPTYAALKHAGSSSINRTALLAVCGAICVLALGVWIWLRFWRKRHVTNHF